MFWAKFRLGVDADAGNMPRDGSMVLVLALERD